MLSHQEAKRRADEHLRAANDSPWVAWHASRHPRWQVWVVSYVDPAHPDETLLGGALVVTDDGAVHEIGSQNVEVDRLMERLGNEPDAWAREGEGLTLLADLDLGEARQLAAYADDQHRRRQQRDR